MIVGIQTVFLKISNQMTSSILELVQINFILNHAASHFCRCDTSAPQHFSKAPTMITRLSSKKKKDSPTVKFSLPEQPQPVREATATFLQADADLPTETVPSNITVPTKALLLSPLQDIFENQPRIVKGRPSIFETVERHQEAPRMIYWESKEAKNLFRPIGDETVRQAIDAQIHLLVGAFNGDNWKSIIDPNANAQQDFFMVPGSIADLKEQAIALSVALDLARRDKPSKTWAACCQEAVTLIYGNDHLISTPKPPTSALLQEWYREFRQGRFFLSKIKRREQKNKVKTLKKELDVAKKENAVLLAKIENELPNVKTNQEATNLLAEIEKDMSRIKIED